jgi:polyisoprenoid-binding protein YceI
MASRAGSVCLKKSATEFRNLVVRALALAAGVLMLVAFEPAAAHAAVMQFKVDPDRSSVSVSVAEPAAFIRGHAEGTFRIIDGAVVGDPADISHTARVRILLDATSYSSGNASRDRTVTEKSLEADKYPTIGFESSSVVGVVMTNPHEGTAIVTGFLTLHGESHAMTMSVHGTLSPDGVFTGDGEVKLDYTDFGVKVPGLLFNSILAGDQATVRFHIVAVNQAASASNGPAAATPTR